MNGTRKYLLVPVVAVAFALLASRLHGQEPTKELTKFVVEGLPVEMYFPGKPEKKEVPGGTQALVSVLEGKAVYFFQYNAFPNELNVLGDMDLAKKIMDGGRDGAMKSIKGSKVRFEKTYLHNGKYPARDIELDAPGLGIYRTLFILTPTHFYQMVVGGPADFTDALPATRFLNSFKIKN